MSTDLIGEMETKLTDGFSAVSSDAKRLIGRRFDDSVVQSDMKHWPFTIINDSSRPKVKVEYRGETKTFYPEEISSMVLLKMKEIAEAYLGKVHKSTQTFSLLLYNFWHIFIICEVFELPFILQRDEPCMFWVRILP